MSSFPDLVNNFEESIDALKVKLSPDADASTTYNGEEIKSIAGDIAEQSKVIGEVFTNAGASKVGTSSGSDVQSELNALTQNQQSGVIVFQTYALLDAYTPTAAQQKGSFKVSNDSDSSLNGYYSWVSGSTYVKDAGLVVNNVDADNSSDAISGSAIVNYVSLQASKSQITDVIAAFGSDRYTFTETIPEVSPTVKSSILHFPFNLSIAHTVGNNAFITVYIYANYTDGSRSTFATQVYRVPLSTTLSYTFTNEQGILTEGKELSYYSWLLQKNSSNAGDEYKIENYSSNIFNIIENNNKNTKTRIDVIKDQTSESLINNVITAFGSDSYVVPTGTANVSEKVILGTNLNSSISVTRSGNLKINSFRVFVYATYTDATEANVGSETVQLSGDQGTLSFDSGFVTPNTGKVVDYYSWLFYIDAGHSGTIYTVDEYSAGIKTVVNRNTDRIVDLEAAITPVYSIDVNNVDYSSMTVVTVKKDGTGNHLTIQEAINFCNLQSPSTSNQFDIQVFDDHVVNSTLELYTLDGVLNTNPVPTEYVAVFTTIDYVHVRSTGANRYVSVGLLIENSTHSINYSRIQTAYVRGNTVISGIDIDIFKGRYAVHQDSFYDVNKTTVFSNSVMSYREEDGRVPSGNGTVSGLNLHYLNCEFITSGRNAYACHYNVDLAVSSALSFSNCIFTALSSSSLLSERDLVSIETLGSGVRGVLTFDGCNINTLMFSNNLYGVSGYESQNSGEWDSQSMILRGSGNSPTLIRQLKIKTLTFETVALNKTFNVTGGSAYDDVYGRDYMFYQGASDAKGLAIGNLRIDDFGYGLDDRLGDCSVDNKTLIVDLDGVESTITFANNYNLLTTSEILDEMNVALGVDVVCTVGTREEDLVNFGDCISSGRNTGASTIERGDAVTFDGSGFARATTGDSLLGFAAGRANAGGNVKVLLKHKCLFDTSDLSMTTTTDGYYKCGANGTLITSALKSDADIIVNGNLGYSI